MHLSVNVSALIDQEFNLINTDVKVEHGVMEDGHLILVSVQDIIARFHEPLYTFLVWDFSVSSVVHENICLDFALLVKLETHFA